MTTFKETTIEVSKPIHVNLHANTSIRMFLIIILSKNYLNFRKQDKKLCIDELEKAFSTNYSSKIASYIYDPFLLFLTYLFRFHKYHFRE